MDYFNRLAIFEKRVSRHTEFLECYNKAHKGGFYGIHRV